MQTNPLEITHLIAAYICGELNDEEEAYLNNWLKVPENKQFFDELTNPRNLIEDLRMYHQCNKEKEIERRRVWKNYEDYLKHSKPAIRHWSRYAIGAAFLIVFLIGGYYFWLSPSNKEQNRKVEVTPVAVYIDKAPGGYKAKLTLGDGRIIVLDNAVTGVLAQQGIANVYNAEKRLIYNVDQSGTADNNVLYNTLVTARGETYQLVLSDGTIVYLNAASSIRYPVAFTGKERTVHITGEAYFEVAKDPAGKPFKVFVATSNKESEEKEVKVLGTHFNINAYNDENAMTTTLLEGSVKVRNRNEQTIIRPNEQAIIRAGDEHIQVVHDAAVKKVVV